MIKNRTWIYCRTAQKDSIEMGKQKERLEAYASEQDFLIVGVSGDMQSGLTLNLPGLLEFRKAVEDKQVDILLISCIDRISRSVLVMVNFLEFLEKYGVRIYTPGGEVDLWNSGPFKQVQKVIREYGFKQDEI